MTISNAELKRHIELEGSIRAVGRLLNIPESTIRTRLARDTPPPVAANDNDESFDVDEVMSEVDVEGLIAERFRKYQRKNALKAQTEMRTIRFASNQPIGLGLMGDPHVDDDGTDLELLFKHADIFDGRNAGLHAILLGDVWNNWVGSLSRLWAEQSTSATEARAIVEHFLKKIQWLAVIFGNHDDWSKWSNILKYILQEQTKIQTSCGQKLRLVFPNKREVILNVRHRWPGKSMWATQFGQLKGAQLDGQADIYVGGDYHVSGYSNGWHPGTQKMYHALQVASYKTHDRYAEELGLPSKDPYVCPVAVIDPRAENAASFIHIEFDPNSGADRVKWLRSKR